MAMIFPQSIKLEQTQEPDRKVPVRKRRRLAKNRIKIMAAGECNLPKLRIKIERLRGRLNTTDLEDTKKILFLSQKLDRLIVIYQRALLKITTSNSFSGAPRCES